MDQKDFGWLIIKSNTKRLIVGVFVLTFAWFISWLILYGKHTQLNMLGFGGTIVLWLLTGLSFFVGLSYIIEPIKCIVKIIRKKHPIFNAILNKDQDHLVWIYNFKTSNRGRINKTIWTYSKEGGKMILNVKGEKVDDVIHYLTQEFPNVVVGYSDETRNLMRQTYGIKP